MGWFYRQGKAEESGNKRVIAELLSPYGGDRVPEQ
jgi:hypothetical protein